MPPKRFEIPSLWPVAAPSLASRSSISPLSPSLGQSDVPLSGLRWQCELAASTTESGPPCSAPPCDTTHFFISPNPPFVVKYLNSGFPCGSSHKGGDHETPHTDC